MSDDAKDEAEEGDWLLARYFKLHLHPSELRISNNIAIEGEASLHITWGRRILRLIVTDVTNLKSCRRG
jgi:hypothetical protein